MTTGRLAHLPLSLAHTHTHTLSKYHDEQQERGNLDEYEFDLKAVSVVFLQYTSQENQQSVVEIG